MKEGITNKNELKKYIAPNVLNNSIPFIWIDEDIIPREIDPSKFNGADFMRIHPTEIEYLETII